MRIEPNDIRIALRKTGKALDEMNIYFEPKYIEQYQARIQKIKSVTREDNPMFEGTNFNRLQAAFRDMLDEVVKCFSNERDKTKDRINVENYLTVAGDYLFAFMQNELDCIEIPKDKFMAFHTELLNASGKIFNAKKDTLAPSGVFFKEQRGKSADALRKKVSEMIEHVKSSDPVSAETLGKLYGEYKALAQRQANHRDIWKLFHGKENSNREALLKEMREALEARIPSKILDDKKSTPSSIAKYGERLNMAKPLSDYLNSRESNPAENMGYNNYIDEPEADGSVKFDRPMKDCLKFLQVNYRPDMSNLAEEKLLIEQLHSAIDKGYIFTGETKQNQAIKELVTQNKLRLGIADEMAERADEWEKYCAAQDKDFVDKHPYYMAPTYIPENYKPYEISKITEVLKTSAIDEVPEDLEEYEELEEAEDLELFEDTELDKNAEGAVREPLNFEQLKADTATEAPMERTNKIHEPPVLSGPGRDFN